MEVYVLKVIKCDGMYSAGIIEAALNKIRTKLESLRDLEPMPPMS